MSNKRNLPDALKSATLAGIRRLRERGTCPPDLIEFELKHTKSYDSGFIIPDPQKREQLIKAAAGLKIKRAAAQYIRLYGKVCPDYIETELATWIVDGKYIRDNIWIDFTEGGNDAVYGDKAKDNDKPQFIPSGEIWLEQDNGDEMDLVLLHELTERREMEQNGLDYDRAHDRANLTEKTARDDPAKLPELLKAEGWGSDYAKSTDMPRRDKKEPGRLYKEADEKKLLTLLTKHFKRQADKISQKLEYQYPQRKSMKYSEGDISDWLLDDDPEFMAKIIILLTNAAKRGVRLFGQDIRIDADYTLTNSEAAAWAKQYAFELVGSRRLADGTIQLSMVDKTTLEVLQNAITSFIETPGFKISDVMDMLPFDEVRAKMIAITEITRAYAEGNQEAANALADQYQGVRVVKQWFTNQDELVCDICAPLGDQGEIGYDESWESDGETYDNPPAHVNCRCWTNYSTALGEE